MRELEINKIIRDEIEGIDMPDVEKNLIYSLLTFERRRSSEGKMNYQKEYMRQLGNAITGMEKK